ncbi:MAG: glutamate-cysteine ligase family protein [Bifidobacteriaceae bacterium]|jgi:glutamate--cysteine ligase|nr:glutamate-cysteine ligase family protein [Bifidobacteriaceae bacterium]MCI1978327.1 glutamate-cysteine ligase family protein [Bifidobacteriaceae bacterium]
MDNGRLHYAHMGATVNEHHLESLMRFISQGQKPHEEYAYGIEIEHLPVSNTSDHAVDLYSTPGVEDFLREIAPYFDPHRETWERGHLLGVNREGLDVSLEPGGQIETAIGPAKDTEEIDRIYKQFRELADPVMSRLGFRLVNYGYQPHTTCDVVKILPTGRYTSLNEYFGRIGSYGIPMMRCSASTQVSIDFSSERDCITKMRLGCAVGPLLAWFFRNSPYFEGRENPLPLLRQEMWDNLDPQRTGLVPGLYEDGFGWEDYAADILSTPLLVADLQSTPEYEGSHQVFTAWRQNAGEIYPDRMLNDAEVSHILSTHFNDVRLKNFLEFRHWDSLPMERALKLVEIVGRLFYDDAEIDRLSHFFSGLAATDVIAAKAMLQSDSAQARPYGRSMEEWRDFLGLTEDDLAHDVPGDTQRPGVFQTV